MTHHSAVISVLAAAVSATSLSSKEGVTEAAQPNAISSKEALPPDAPSDQLAGMLFPPQLKLILGTKLPITATA